MPLSEEQRNLFTRFRSENLSTEIKEFLDLSTDEGRAKLIKACQAIYNRNGGFLLVGFDNEGNPKPLAGELLTQFTADRIQEIVSKYSKPAFEVDVDFLYINENKYPILIIPSGVRVPAYTRKGISSQDGKVHLQNDTVFVRTLQQNGRASTSAIRPHDFTEILDICFANRETDIASFLRKHLPDIGLNRDERTVEPINYCEILKDEVRAIDEVTTDELRNLSEPKLENWLLSALTLKVAVICDPIVQNDGVPSQTFLSKVFSSNPNLTGWPVWMDTQGFTDRRARPHASNGGWNAIVPFGASNSGLEVYRFTPGGKLYLRRVLQDDTTDKVERGTQLDPYLLILRTAEVAIVALHILRGIGASEEATAHFRFECTGLRGRKTASWANFDRHVGPRVAYDDHATACVSIPVAVDPRQISPFVSKIMRPLLAAFDGLELSDGTVDELVLRLIERRL